MQLGAGAEILQHRDHQLGMQHGSARIHVAIRTNPQVDFRVNGQRIELAAGEAWYLDFSQPHTVVNRGAEARVHLVLDCVVDDWLRARIAEGTRCA
jgi:hypothetical protein